MTDSTIPGPKRGEKRVLGWLLSIGSGGTIAWLTLVRAGAGASPPTGGGTLLTDIVLNLLLFVPLGIGLALTGRSTRSAAAIGTVASAAIESAQFLWLPSRDAALHDLLTNAIGTLLGALLVHGWSSRARWWRLGGPCLSLGMAAAWIAGAAVLRPAVPKGAVWYGFWAHQLGDAVQFPGRIVGFTVNADSIPDGRIQDQAAFHSRITSISTITAEVRLIVPPPFGGLAQLASIMSPSGDELLSLWQEGDDLFARVRLQTTDARLRTPWFVLADGLEGLPGDTLTITLESTRNRVRLTVRGPAPARAEDIHLASELFWAAFVPWDYSVSDHPAGWPLLATVLIFGALGLGSTRHPGAGMAVATITLFLAPPLIGSAASEWLTLGLALIAVITGQLLGRHRGFGRG